MTPVEKIRHEFYISGERLLKEAERLLNGKERLLDKAEKLKKVGFVNSVEVGKADDLKISRDLAETVNYYLNKYPFNKFIIEDQVTQINKKYNLVCAPIQRYKGFVPSEKLDLIESFSLKKEDALEPMIKIKKFAFHSVEEEFNRAGYDKNALYPLKSLRQDFLRLEEHAFWITQYDLIKDDGLFICAPKKDMDMKGLVKVGSLFASFTLTRIPDPVVLQPVKGGFLIIAAWGDESSDPIVVNQINN